MPMPSPRVAAALLGVVVVLVACGSPISTPSPQASQPETVAWQQQNVTFAHPVRWQWYPFDPAIHTNRFDVLGYLATAPIDVAQICSRSANPRGCDVGAFVLEPGSLAVTIRSGTSLSADVWQDEAPPDTQATTAGGMPALSREQLADDGVLQLQWMIARPDVAGGWFELSAKIRGPGEAAARQELADLLASVAFVPPVEPLPDEDRALTDIGVDTLTELRAPRRARPAYACFPDRPGARPGVVDSLPGMRRLKKPLPVSCSLRVEATRWNLYRVRLRYAWADMAGRSAGSYLITYWVTADGRLDASLAEGDSP